MNTRPCYLAAVLLVAILDFHSAVSQSLPSSFPHNYPGQPKSEFGPDWQSYFQVTEKLPNITFDVGRSFAGNIPTSRDGHPNNTLFFWGFEKRNGSLTAPANESNNEPWGIWLNGGPGSSSLFGLLFQNGPIRINSDYTASANNYSWNKLADFIWIDQPVGTGYSTADSKGYVADDDQMGRDFFGFLGNLVKVFPSLATRPLYLTGESYAGVYIPYILKIYFGLQNPPVKIAKIAIGDGSIASGQVFELVPAISVIETYPQIIGYDPDVYKYFKAQHHLCGYDLNLTYPQTGLIPGPPLILPTQRDIPFLLQNRLTRYNFMTELAKRYSVVSSVDKPLSKRSREVSRSLWKRDLSGRSNGSIDPWYGCLFLDEFMDYAINFTFPWNLSQPNSKAPGFNIYNIPDALSPQALMDGTVFLNDNRTRAALHAPTSKEWQLSIEFAFGEEWDTSPEPMTFLSALATNASSQNIPIVLYSGNDDALIAHFGTEVTIQNTTFGGIQGFTRKPSTPWFDDAGNFAGIVHQERNWTYVLFNGAGHLVPTQKPVAAYTFLREFVLGNNATGLVTNSSGTMVVVGGENSTLAENILPGQAEIYYGSGTTQSTYIFPSATIAAWNSFIRTETVAPNTIQTSPTNAGRRSAIPIDLPVTIVICLLVSYF